MGQIWRLRKRSTRNQPGHNSYQRRVLHAILDKQRGPPLLFFLLIVLFYIVFSMMIYFFFYMNISFNIAARCRQERKSSASATKRQMSLLSRRTLVGSLSKQRRLHDHDVQTTRSTATVPRLWICLQTAIDALGRQHGFENWQNHGRCRL